MEKTRGNPGFTQASADQSHCTPLSRLLQSVQTSSPPVPHLTRLPIISFKEDLLSSSWLLDTAQACPGVLLLRPFRSSQCAVLSYMTVHLKPTKLLLTVYPRHLNLLGSAFFSAPRLPTVMGLLSMQLQLLCILVPHTPSKGKRGLSLAEPS